MARRDREEYNDEEQQKGSRKMSLASKVGVVVKLVIVCLLCAAVLGLGIVVGGIKVSSIPFLKDMDIVKNFGDMTIGQFIDVVGKVTADPEEVKATVVKQPVDTQIPQELEQTYNNNDDDSINYSQPLYTDSQQEITLTGQSLGAIVNKIISDTEVEGTSLGDFGLSMEQLIIDEQGDNIGVDAVACLNVSDIKDLPEEAKAALDELNISVLYLQLNFDMVQEGDTLVYDEDVAPQIMVNNSEEVTNVLLPILNEISGSDSAAFIGNGAGDLLSTLIGNLGAFQGFDEEGNISILTNTQSGDE